MSLDAQNFSQTEDDPLPREPSAHVAIPWDLPLDPQCYIDACRRQRDRDRPDRASGNR